MATFYDKYLKLCDFKGVNPTKAALEIGLSKATPTKWKNTDATPNGKTLKKIAEYFHVQESFLLHDDWVLSPFSKEELTLIELYRKADEYDKETILRILTRYQQDTHSTRVS